MRLTAGGCELRALSLPLSPVPRWALVHGGDHSVSSCSIAAPPPLSSRLHSTLAAAVTPLGAAFLVVAARTAAEAEQPVLRHVAWTSPMREARFANSCAATSFSTSAICAATRASSRLAAARGERNGRGGAARAGSARFCNDLWRGVRRDASPANATARASFTASVSATSAICASTASSSRTVCVAWTNGPSARARTVASGPHTCRPKIGARISSMWHAIVDASQCAPRPLIARNDGASRSTTTTIVFL